MYLDRFDLPQPMKHWLEKSTEELFGSLLKKISGPDLKTFFEEAAKEDPALRENFIIHFIESANIPADEKYPLLIRSIAKLGHHHPGKFQNELSRYLTKAKQFIETRDYLDGFYMSAGFIGEFKQLLTNEKNLPTEYLEKIFILLSSISKSDAAFELKEKVFDFLLNEAKKHSSDFNSNHKEAWLDALIDSAPEENQLQWVLNLIVVLTGENRSQYGQVMDEKEAEQLLKMKLRVLELLKRDEDIRHLLQSNTRIKAFRTRLIQDFIRQHKWDEAKDLIKDGRREELRKGNLNLSADWDEWLLKIAQEENDVKTIRNLSLQLFLSSDYDFSYYHLLKQYYEPSRWKAQTDRIISSMRKEKVFATKGIHAAAKIFIEEEEWEKLLRLIEKNASLDFVQQYFDFLKEKYPQELLEIYRKAIRRFAEKFMGPESYRVVANALKKMQSLPDSKEIVQSLAIELKVTYRQRRAMVEELNKVVL